MKSEEENFAKYFKMARLEERPLYLEKMLHMIKKIEEIDVACEEPYEKHWIQSKMRLDEVVVDEGANHFMTKKRVENFFVVSTVVKH